MFGQGWSLLLIPCKPVETSTWSICQRLIRLTHWTISVRRVCCTSRWIENKTTERAHPIWKFSLRISASLSFASCQTSLSLKHSWGFMCFVTVYVPTEVCWSDEIEMFHTKLDSVLDHFSARTHSLSWKTSMLSLALIKLATSYLFLFLILQNSKD